MLNFDALGTGSGVSVFGDGDITALVSDIGDQVNVDVAVTLSLKGGSSDVAGFWEAGVPSLMSTSPTSTPSATPWNSCRLRCSEGLRPSRRHCYNRRSSRT